MGSGENGDRGEHRQAAGVFDPVKESAHRVLRPVGHSLLKDARITVA
jgi:hypothetical protein